MPNDMTQTGNVWTRLQKFFGMTVKPNAEHDYEKIVPMEYVRDKEGNKKLQKVVFDDEVDQLFKRWLSTTHTDSDRWKGRQALWEDMDRMYYNSPLIARAIELIADESLQAATNDQVIFIEGKTKVKKFIQKFFDDVNINKYLRSTLIDIIQYGNSGWLLGFDDKGINEIIPIPIYAFKERLEFTPYELNNEIKAGNRFINDYMKIDRIGSLVDSITDKENCTSYFKKYLFGFQIEDRVVPPWKFLHFKNETNKSPFKPFGVPVYIHAMSAYSQYDAAMTIQQSARAAKFPKHLYKIDMPSVVAPTEKLQRAVEFMNELQNVGIGQSKKEIPGVGDFIVTIKDLFEYEEIQPQIDLGKIDDIEMLRDEIIVATMLPRYIIDPKDSGFGDSGISLVEKWKPFARLVYRMQSILLENLTQLVKVHMIYSNEFSLDEMDFSLSMKYPESQTNQDIVSSQNSLLDLANNIIGAIQDKVTGGEQLPPELLKTIYTQFLPYDTNRINDWIDSALKAKDNGETGELDPTSPFYQADMDQQNIDIQKDAMELGIEEPVETEESSNLLKEYRSKQQIKKINEAIKAKQRWVEFENDYGRTNLKEAVENIIFEEKLKVLRESTIRGRHVYTSKNKYVDFPAEQLREFDKKRLEKYRLNEDISSYAKEEVEYNFTFDHEDYYKEEEKKKVRKKKK